MRFGAGGCPSSSPSHRKSPPMPSGDAGIESSSTWQPASSHPGAPRAAPLISSERKEEGREEVEVEGEVLLGGEGENNITLNESRVPFGCRALKPWLM